MGTSRPSIATERRSTPHSRPTGQARQSINANCSRSSLRNGLRGHLYHIIMYPVSPPSYWHMGISHPCILSSPHLFYELSSSDQPIITPSTYEIYGKLISHDDRIQIMIGKYI